jgi:hypothetical protein
LISAIRLPTLVRDRALVQAAWGRLGRRSGAVYHRL